MKALTILIPVVLAIVAVMLIKYDRSKNIKSKHITWLSKHVFKDNTGANASAARLIQTIISFVFIFCVGIAALFVIGLFEK